MNDWHIAQINVALAQFPLDDPRIADFMDQLDEINALADVAPGFVWRLQTESGDATDVQVGDDDKLIVNMSVWDSIGNLFDYVYQTAHTGVMRRRREWFEKSTLAHQALWWVPAGHTPSPEEGMARLENLRANGPSPSAFNFKNRFPPTS